MLLPARPLTMAACPPAAPSVLPPTPTLDNDERPSGLDPAALLPLDSPPVSPPALAPQRSAPPASLNASFTSSATVRRGSSGGPAATPNPFNFQPMMAVKAVPAPGGARPVRSSPSRVARRSPMLLTEPAAWAQVQTLLGIAPDISGASRACSTGTAGELANPHPHRAIPLYLARPAHPQPVVSLPPLCGWLHPVQFTGQSRADGIESSDTV